MGTNLRARRLEGVWGSFGIYERVVSRTIFLVGACVIGRGDKNHSLVSTRSCTERPFVPALRHRLHRPRFHAIPKDIPIPD
jgi:hypothetical protein